MTYERTEKQTEDERGGVRTVYGVRASSGEHVDDLGCDGAAVADFVARCNRCCLSPLHLRDASEDFLLR